MENKNVLVEEKMVVCSVCGKEFDVYQEGDAQDGYFFCCEDHYDEYLTYKAMFLF